MADETIKVTGETAIPVGAKKPQDRRKKVVVKDGYRIATLNGVEVRVHEDLLDDFELLDELSYIEENPGFSGRILRRMVGKDTYGELLDKARDPETGKVSVEAGAAILSDLFDLLTPNS